MTDTIVLELSLKCCFNYACKSFKVNTLIYDTSKLVYYRARLLQLVQEIVH